MRVAAILCVTLATIPVFGVLVNRTIDDFAGDEMTGLQVSLQALDTVNDAEQALGRVSTSGLLGSGS